MLQSPWMTQCGRWPKLMRRPSPIHLLPCRLASAPTWRCRAAHPHSCCRCSPSTTSCRQGRCGVGRWGTVGNGLAKDALGNGWEWLRQRCHALGIRQQSIRSSACGRLCSSQAAPNPSYASIILQLWREAEPQPITVEGLHRHVMGLHAAFLSGLDAAGHPTINSSTLLPPQVRGG